MTSTLFALLIGMGFGASAWLGWIAYRGVTVLPDPRRLVPSVRPERATLVIAGAGVAGLFVGSLTGWPVAGLAAAGLVLASPQLLGVKAAREREIARQKAVAAWAEMTRDTVAAGNGLQEALIEAADVSAEAIQPEMQAFKRRAERLSLEEALERLADDLAMPTADFVVAALLNAARNNARDLAAMLARLAESIRDEVDMRIEIDARRAGARTEVKSVVVLSVLTVAVVTVYSRPLVEAYDSVTGQIVMAMIFALFVAGTVALLRLAAFPVPERFRLRRPEHEVVE